MSELPFRTPFQIWSDGTYITVVQLEMYARTGEGCLAVEEASDAYFEYIDYCRGYNLVYDALNIDPTQGKMFWDDKAGRLDFTLVEGGKLHIKLESLVPLKYLHLSDGELGEFE